MPVSTFEKIMLNLEPYFAIPRKTTNCSPSNYTCIDAGRCLEAQGDCNAEFWAVLDGDLPLKGPYFHRNPTSIVLQSKNTWQNRNQHIRFAQNHFLRPHQQQIHAETLRNFGYHRCHILLIRITYAIICMGSLWGFLFLKLWFAVFQ